MIDGSAASRSSAMPERVAALARAALEEEPCVWPRLGLVGPDDPGGHRDMDYACFLASAAVLEPYFADLVRLGATPGPSRAARVELARQLGLAAERRMLEATRGRNTHKGAIFLLGVLVLAWAMLAGRRDRRRSIRVDDVLGLAHAAFGPGLARELAGLRASDSYGAWAHHRHGSLGVRGLVLGRFAPLARVWRHTTSLELAGHARAPERLGCARLLALALSDDTNLLKRAGRAMQARLRGEAYALWSRGGPLDARNHRELVRFDAELARRRLSAAASGDLIAAILLLRKLCHEGLAAA